MSCGFTGQDIIGYEKKFRVVTAQAADITAVALIRPGATTHGFDQEQRFMNLTFTIEAGQTEVLSIDAPAAPEEAPPGYYMLFIIDDSGVPSVAKIIKLDPTCPAFSPTPTPTPAPAPHDSPKNRYLSFTPPIIGGLAIKVDLIPDPEHPGPATAWVGVPNATGVAELVSAPVERFWTEPVVHVHGCRIVPVAAYNFSSTDGNTFSSLLVVSTIDKPTGAPHWGDCVGFFDTNTNTWTPPDGVTNIFDALATIKAIQGDPTAPHKSWVDIEPMIPNVVVNISDTQQTILAFQGGEYPFCDPGDCATCGGPTPAPCCPTPPSSGVIDFSMTADVDLIGPTEQVVIDVYTAPASDVAAYEMSLEVLGGATGTLDLTAMNINKTRPDYIFTGKTVADVVDNNGGRFGATTNDASSVEVTVANGYLGTFTLTASADASGVFEVKVRGIDKAFLSDSTANLLDMSPGDSIFIGVGVECVNDGHCDDASACTDDTCVGNVCQFTDNCDDFNDCTTDTCNAGVCNFVNVSSGTPCDDGRFCTTPDRCNGSGTCVGGTRNPCLPGELCVEIMDTCIPL